MHEFFLTVLCFTLKKIYGTIDFPVVKDINKNGARSIQPKFPEILVKTQWIGSVQPEKFRKNWSTFWGGPLLPVGPVWILVEWIAPMNLIQNIPACFLWLKYSVQEPQHERDVNTSRNFELIPKGDQSGRGSHFDSEMTKHRSPFDGLLPSTN